jgi:hypothetical protein
MQDAGHADQGQGAIGSQLGGLSVGLERGVVSATLCGGMAASQRVLVALVQCVAHVLTL